ncbi:hypothetical protein RJ639_004450 [Escallonia herrerae]|uniref:DUF4283 domain-containing protein n=1 Tax=Escallonia herrerae TaxID=1293975 RepID=A0AA88W4P2_9ASTE|nr:hypothetical protein RJ639_004450 [Escallonia herrerae]
MALLQDEIHGLELQGGRLENNGHISMARKDGVGRASGNHAHSDAPVGLGVESVTVRVHGVTIGLVNPLNAPNKLQLPLKIGRAGRSEINGVKGIDYSIKDVEDEMNQWRNSLVINVLGARPPFYAMKVFSERIWKCFANFQLSMSKLGVFTAKFFVEDAIAQILESGPWSFDNKPLIIKELCRCVQVEGVLEAVVEVIMSLGSTWKKKPLLLL